MWFWIIGWFLVALAVVGNASVIYLIFKTPRLQTNPSWFVLSLAVADLIAALVYFPTVFGANFLYTIDTTHAGAFFKISFTCFYFSNTNLFMMAVDRYLAISRPLGYITFMTKTAIFGLITLAWVAPLLLFGLPAYFTYQDNPGYTLFIEYTRVVIFQMLPLAVFLGVTCHLLYISHKLTRETRNLVMQVRFNHTPGHVGVPCPPAPQNTDRKATTIMILLVITFFNITYLGGNYRCICILTKLCKYEGIQKKLIVLTLIANAAVNPIVYAFVKRDIRKELRRLFKLPEV